MADNTTDKILLSPANNIPGIVVPCLFSGHLQGDVEAVVSVSGCKDKNTTVSIASKKVPDGLIDLAISATGETSKIALQFEETTEDPKQNPRTRRHDWSNDALEADPELPLDDGISALPASRDGPLPKSVTLEIYLRYDNSLLAVFSDSATQVKQWLSKVVELAKPKLALLDVKILLKVAGRVDHYNKNIRASEADLHNIQDELWNKEQKGPISYFSAGTKDSLCSTPVHVPQAPELGLRLLGLLATLDLGSRSTSTSTLPFR